jgi:Copper type II ascorbate-dependent monooxygenase, C-terminal domain
VHYHKNGKPETDATTIGLYLSDKPLPRRIGTGFVFPTIGPLQAVKLTAQAKVAQQQGKRLDLTDMLRDVLVIPAGADNYEVKGSSKATLIGRPLSRDVLLTAVMPHMHWLGKDFSFWAVLPDEAKTRVPLIRIDHWNFNWQGTYAFAEPIPLPKGSWLEMEAHFDNTEGNPQNQTKPPKTVHWGDQTTDEMCIGIFEFIPVDAPANAPGKPDAVKDRPKP